MFRTIHSSTFAFTILLGVFLSASAEAAPRVGQKYKVDARCVTLTRVRNGQASYEWTQGNASGSGNLPVSHLKVRCDGGAAPASAPAPAPSPAPAPGTWSFSPVPAPHSRPPAPPSGGDGGQPAGNGEFTAAEIRALVEEHNRIRADVGVGPVTWDPAVATYAQRYVRTRAARCALEHSDSQYGENLAAWSGSRPPSQGVKQWESEKPGYHGRGGPFTNTDFEAGHYTQIIWRHSARIGCGRVNCRANGFDMTILSCNYSPRGNMMGERVY